MNQSVQEVINNWPKDPKESAESLIKEYGEPNEFSESRLIWYDTKDGWKRTELSKEEVPHRFPSPHTDYLEQFIDYKVPIEMYSKLAEYDGSVMLERTKGEMSARCGGTSMNFVAINLAHEIIHGKRTVQDARRKYTELYQAHKRGEKNPYYESFQFELPKDNTADPDRATM